MNYDSLWQRLPENNFCDYFSFSDAGNSQGQSCLWSQYTVTILKMALIIKLETAKRTGLSTRWLIFPKFNILFQSLERI